ncbi:RIP metalloprotease RseP [Lysobacter pythonis]|uniref:Zinc metalloprotease n=1 Tax=Solilutibacter pythonis TaxID=2483112 RepID=A0A3M2HSA4_9GAMM|nr:RIP metalloprotease RseP [Lysobacter pythonis]RMH91135.1 RIP metalloprotease RseP [Lysobacter pythonis]
MSAVLGPLFWLIVSLGILVTIHEFGHFWVARRCGVKVLRFSIGFGKPLWRRLGKDGTEYVIAAIPLGGYVKMLDEREGNVPAVQLEHAFNRQSVWRRIAIVAAGPLANLALCVTLLWAMFVVGRPDYAPDIGRAQALAAESGFRPGERILSIDDQPTPTWSEAGFALIASALDRQPVTVRVRDASGIERERTLHLERLPEGVRERQALAAVGILPVHALVPAVVGEVAADGPAASVLRAGERILAIDGRPVDGFDALRAPIGAAGEAGRPLRLRVERDGVSRTVELTPVRMRHPEAGEYWGIGIAAADVQAPRSALLRHGPLAAVPAAFGETWRLTRDSLAMMGRMLRGAASIENVSGPITIARVADHSAGMGAAWFLSFLALVSLSLAIINLLPIPILDGGHLLYYLIELVKGSPPSERAMIIGQYFGLAMLAGLMGLAFYNDIHGLLR